MTPNQTRLSYLYQRWLSKSATDAERQEFLLLLQSSDAEKDLSPLLKQAWTTISEEEGLYSTAQKIKLADLILSGAPAVQLQTTIVHRVHFLRRSWFRYAAAAVLLFGAATIFLVSKTNNKPTESASLANSQPQNIQPGKERAILTLADGSEITLDSATNGLLAQQGNARVVKLADGRVAYNLEGSTANTELLNTMKTPRGGQYQLTLPDGSRVWLNAASSITFPAAFTGNARNVKITGEAYFEVSADAARPFMVEADDQLIEVLGTSFNVNAYRDEATTKSSLVSGKIKVSGNGGDAVLKPGQAWVNGTVVSTDISQDIAWKNGAFDFNGKSIQTVLKEIERWYDLDVNYKGEKPVFRLKGGMDRGLQLDAVLDILKMQGLEIERNGRKLIVAEQQNQ